MKRIEGEARRKRKPVVYWDACLFIDWLKGKPRTIPAETEGLAEQVRQFEANELTVVTSTLTVVEVLESYIPDEQRPKLESLKQMPDKLFLAQVRHQEAILAHDIRDYYKRLGGQEALTVATADAIHLATAILYKCDVFYTFDEENRKDDRGVKCLGLIPLSGNVAGHNLRIERPPPPAQSNLQSVGLGSVMEEGGDESEEDGN